MGAALVLLALLGAACGGGGGRPPPDGAAIDSAADLGTTDGGAGSSGQLGTGGAPSSPSDGSVDDGGRRSGTGGTSGTGGATNTGGAPGTTGAGGAPGAGGQLGTGGTSGGALPADDAFDGTALSASWTVLRPDLADVAVAGGALSITPHPYALWFETTQGELVYKLATGDFKVTTTVHARQASNRTMTPNQYADVGGIMARNPSVTATMENYVLAVAGFAEMNQLAIEHKSTTNGASIFGEMPWPSGDAELRLCRTGSTFAAYVRSPGSSVWAAPFMTFTRPDLPAGLQVGPCAYDNASSPNFVATFDSFAFAPVGSGCTE